MTAPPVYAPASATICSAMRRFTAWPTLATTATKNTRIHSMVTTIAVDCPRSEPKRARRIVSTLVDVRLHDARRQRCNEQSACRDVVEDRQAERHAHLDAQAPAVQAGRRRVAVVSAHSRLLV